MDSTGAAVVIVREELDSVLTFRGAFHLDLAPDLHRAALELAGTGGKVMVDCSQVEHLDGCAIQVLLALKLALERTGGSLHLRGESEEIRKYLGWAGLEGPFGYPAAGQVPKRRRNSRKRPA